jgi:NADH-quinone oxidoreductase subunit D
LGDYVFGGNYRKSAGVNSRWYSMEELISHFIFYSEGPSLPVGFSVGAVEAPKGHLGVEVFSRGGSKLVRARIRSSILVMSSHLSFLTAGVAFGDFVTIISASNVVVGEIDR